MQDQNQFLALLFDAFREPLCLLDQERECVLANSALLNFLRLENAGPFSLRVNDFWPTVANVDLKLPEVASEFMVSKADPYAVKLSFSTLENGYTLVRLLAGVSRDETFLNFQAQRLETLGMLAGGVAHDFNNVLAGILGHITYLKTVLPQSGNHVESLTAIEEGAKKASLITQQILNFSKMDIANKPRKVNLSDLLVKTCRLLRGAISPEFRIEYKLHEEQIYVLGVEGSLAQVMVNLVVNSRDALSSDGYIKLRVEPSNDLDEVRRAYRSSELTSQHYCKLIVEDNGHGMPPEVIERIFEPYFSTKKDKGTGLGMATVHSIVRHLGGAIDVASTVGEGTQMSVYFPRLVSVSMSETTPAGTPVRESAPRLMGGDERILVVDDEFPVRNVICVSLEHLGYKVQTAASGVEALDKFTASTDPVDLVVLDMLMPNLPGEKVLAKLRKINPQLRVLLISGYSAAETIEKALELEGVDFIQKPFTIDDLAKKVRTSLDFEFAPIRE